MSFVSLVVDFSNLIYSIYVIFLLIIYSYLYPTSLGGCFFFVSISIYCAFLLKREYCDSCWLDSGCGFFSLFWLINKLLVFIRKSFASNVLRKNKVTKCQQRHGTWQSLENRLKSVPRNGALIRENYFISRALRSAWC